MTDHPDDGTASHNVLGRLLTRLMLSGVLVVVSACAVPPSDPLEPSPIPGPAPFVWTIDHTPTALDTPTSVAADGACECVFTFDPTGHLIRIVRGAAAMTPPTAIRFGGTLSVAVTSEDRLVVLEESTGRLLTFDSRGSFVRAWQSQEAPGKTGPTIAVATDPHGGIYVSNSSGITRHFDRQGQLLGQWGNEEPKWERLDRPRDMAVDGQGNVYIVDQWRRVVKLAPSGEVIARWGHSKSE